MKVQITTNKARLLAQLQEYRKRLEKYMDEVVKAVSSKIAEYAREKYGNAVFVESAKVASENGVAYEITAMGEAVCFLEFGAGTRTDIGGGYSAEFEAATGISVEPGSWSASEDGKQQFVRWGFWILRSGVRMYYVEPRRALYYAVHDHLDEFENIAITLSSILGSTR